MSSYRRAMDLRRALARSDPNEKQYKHLIASSLQNIGSLLHDTGHPVNAMAAYREALGIREDLARDDPGAQDDLAGLRNNIALLLIETDRPTEALENYRRVLAIREKRAGEEPGSVQGQSELADILHNLALLLNDMERGDEALDAFLRELAIRDRLARDEPSIKMYQSDLAHSLNGTGFMLDVRGRKDEALAMHRRALAIRERLVADDPAVAGHQSDMARSLSNIGSLLDESGHPDQAVASYDRARATLEQLTRENPLAHFFRFMLGGVLTDLAGIEIDRQHWPAAKQYAIQGVDRYRQALAAMPNNRRYLAGLRRGLAKLIRVQAALDDIPEALRRGRELVNASRGEPMQLYNAACDLSLSSRLASPDRGRPLADEAVSILSQAIAAGWANVALMATDGDLDPLRERDDFRRLLDEQLDRAFPASPFAR